MAVLWIASSGLLVASGIPFATPRQFADNPMVADATLPPMPDALRPMGPPKAVPIPRTEAIIAPLPDPDSKTGKPVSKEERDAKDAREGRNVMGTGTPSDSDTADNSENAAPRGEQKTTTVSPFMDWVRKNHDSEDLARAQRNQYKSPAPGQGGGDDPDNDLMLNIRYPYMWNQQQPPAASAVIYTIPKR
jgi:hypothetical protein